MKSLRFLPLAYIAGVHGFMLLVPYLALLAACLTLARRFRTPTI